MALLSPFRASRRLGNWEGKSVIVAGGGGQFGGLVVKLLAEAGAQLVVADLNLANAQRNAGLFGGLAMGLDVNDPAMWANLVSATIDMQGSPALLVYCVAETRADRPAWDFDVNGLVHGFDACQPSLAATKGAVLTWCGPSAYQIAPGEPIDIARQHAKRALMQAWSRQSADIAFTLVSTGLDPHHDQIDDHDCAAAGLWGAHLRKSDVLVPDNRRTRRLLRGLGRNQAGMPGHLL